MSNNFNHPTQLEGDALLQFQAHMSKCTIEAGALQKVSPFLEQQGYKRIQLVVDSNTYLAAGKQLEQLLQKNKFSVYRTELIANKVGDIAADEQSIIQLLLDLQQNKAEVVIAVGGGTIHDITRYAAYTHGISFIAVPTAPSVDGFNSMGAPIITRGYKRTIQSIGPEAVFADLDVLVKAPRLLIAAGYGDILGKYTSLFDWKFGVLTNDEPFLQSSDTITQQALQLCVAHTAQIARRDEEGIALLTRGLMESGVAMLILGTSRPASGAEHHLSHYWEMEYIKQGKKQLLHGAKVGCSCIEISALYHQLAKEDWGLSSLNKRIQDNWDTIKQNLQTIPQADELKALLAEVGGPAHYSELGIPEQLALKSLQEAHQVRPERFTLLHARNLEQ